MTDKEKLEKVRAEIERVKKNQEGVFTSYTDGKFDLCEHLLSFIDSMQEEPKECIYSKDNYTDKDRKVLCDGCKEECKFNKKEEPASEIDFEAEVKKLWEEINTGHSYSIVDSYNIFYGLCMDIAEWQKQKDSIPVSENLDKEIDNAHKLFYEEVGWDSDEGARAYVADWFAHYFANWQKQQDLKPDFRDASLYVAREEGIEIGKAEMRQQMMAKAVDATVHIDAGGYPYIPQIELYDYDKDIPLAKEGDKYKVVLIKEV